MITKEKKKFTGSLRQRVTFQKEELISDGMGGGFPQWVDDFQAWANIKPVSGNQRLHLDAVESTVTHVVETRYRSDVSFSGRRMTYNGREFNLHYVINEGEENAYTEIAAAELQ